MTAPAPLDLGKPMRRKGCGPNISVLWYDAFGALVVYEDHSRAYLAMAVLPELFENMPPEPPKVMGPENVWVFVGKGGQVGCALLGDSPRSDQYVRYLRADLATANAARKVKALALHERANLREATTGTEMECAFVEIMAARGIEVGE